MADAAAGAEKKEEGRKAAEPAEGQKPTDTAKKASGATGGTKADGPTGDCDGPAEGGGAPLLREPSEGSKEGSSGEEKDEAAALMDQLALGHEASSEMKKVLVLLDFNGTLVFRDTGKPETVITGKVPDFVVCPFRGTPSKFFLRPLAKELVCTLLNDPRCAVGIYTSMKQKNMNPVLVEFDRFHERMTAQDFGTVHVYNSDISSHTSIVDGILDVFDADYNAKDRTGDNPWDTKRDLNQIWRHRSARSFDRSNTLILEAETRKVQDWKDNAAIVPEFTRDVVRRGGDAGLRGVLDFLNNKVFPAAQNGTPISRIVAGLPRHAGGFHYI